MEAPLYPNYEILWNITGKSAYVLTNDINRYYWRINNAIEDIEKGKSVDCSYLLFSFIALAASTLEYTLNLMISCWQLHEFNKEECRDKMKFKSKDEKLVGLITRISNKYKLDENNSNVIQLRHLIKLRNNLMHNTEALEIAFNDMPNIDAQVIDGNLVIPEDNTIVEFVMKTTENIVDNLTDEMCIGMGKALVEFKDKVAVPYLTYHEFEENDMVIVCRD
jgi:hypothetical protein